MALQQNLENQRAESGSRSSTDGTVEASLNLINEVNANLSNSNNLLNARFNSVVANRQIVESGIVPDCQFIDSSGCGKIAQSAAIEFGTTTTKVTDINTGKVLQDNNSSVIKVEAASGGVSAWIQNEKQDNTNYETGKNKKIDSTTGRVEVRSSESGTSAGVSDDGVNNAVAPTETPKEVSKRQPLSDQSSGNPVSAGNQQNGQTSSGEGE